MTLWYEPDLGGVADPAGNPLGARPAGVGDGIAPAVASAAVAGPGEAAVRYSEPVRATPGAYKAVSLSTGGGPRPVTGLAGNETAAHAISFGGEPAPPGTDGALRVDGTAVRDAAGNWLGPGLESLHLRDGQGPAQQPARPGHASVERAVFTARNTAAITYSGALWPPASHGGGPVYASVMIDGEDGARGVAGVEGLGTAVHEVAFDGAGVDGNRTGAVSLAVDLEGAGAGAGAPPRFEAGLIPIAGGRTAHVAMLSPQQADRTVAIEPDGFVPQGRCDRGGARGAPRHQRDGAGGRGKAGIGSTGRRSVPTRAGCAGPHRSARVEFPPRARRLGRRRPEA